MKQVLLLFTDSSKMADFVINQQIGNAEVNTGEQSLVATMEDEDILIAERDYGGRIKVHFTDHSC